jgi:penicillin-binding protein 1A
MLRVLFKLFCTFCLLGIVSAGGFSYWFYNTYLIDLPNLKGVSDYQPPAVSQVFASDNQLLAEYFKERRYPVKLSEIPSVLIKAMLAAEDVDFYKHPGVDLWGILRAFSKNIQEGAALQGGSTITQQVVKNLLLDSRKTFERKAKEALLSYRLEKRLSKIYFGNTSYGVKAAAEQYFHVKLSDITLAQAALLAALPKAPTHYSPLTNLSKAKSRQRYVLEQMLKSNFITEEQFSEALNENLSYYTADSENRFYHAPYFLRELNAQFAQKFPNLKLEYDGLRIFTTNDPVAQKLAEQSLRSGIRAVDRRQGYRGPLVENISNENFLNKFKSPTTAELQQHYYENSDFTVTGKVTSLNWVEKTGAVQIGKSNFKLYLGNLEWLGKRIDENGLRKIPYEQTLKVNDVVEVKLNTGKSRFDNLVYEVTQTPKLQGASVLIDPHSGQVSAMVGGYDYLSSSYNRVVQSYRQPGSAFKPIVYLAAIDKFGYTPATIVNDTPRAFKINGKYWEPSNFDKSFLGPITLQTALERSRNVVVAELIADIGIKTVIEYAQKLGIKAKLGENLSLALGSAEIPLIEMTRAYGVLASSGILHPTSYITRIEDRFGNEIYNASLDSTLKPITAVSEESAFILSKMMTGVVERGTATALRVLGRPLAGKTGTTNNQMDAWFVGFNPDWAAGIWVGFDQKKEIGSKETGGKVAVPIWEQFMKAYLNLADGRELLREVGASVKAVAGGSSELILPQEKPVKDFLPPSTLEPKWINRFNGHLTSEDDPQGLLTYFLPGTAPTHQAYEEEVLSDYLDSPEL